MIPPLLGQRPFRNFWLGETISVFGDQITQLAVPIVAVLVLGAEPAQMGLLTAVGLLPHLLFSLPAGVWLDRVASRRRMMIVADVGRALFIVSIPVAYVAGILNLPQLYVVAFAVGSLTVVFDIAWNTFFVAVTPREDFVSANSLLSGSRSLANVGGPAIGGVLMQVFGAPLAVLLDALSFLGSAFFLSINRATEPPVEEATTSIRDQLAAGVSFILRDPIMRPTLFSVAWVNLFNFAFSALVILYVTTYLGVDVGALGLAVGAGAVGGILGAVVAARVGRRIGIGRAYAVGLLLFPAPLIAIPLIGGSTAVILATLFGAEFLSGFGVMILDINAGALITARIPDAIRSRATGSWRFVNYGVRPIGALMGGLLGTLIGVQETLLLATVVSLFGVLFLFRSPVLGLHDVPETGEV